MSHELTTVTAVVSQLCHVLPPPSFMPSPADRALSSAPAAKASMSGEASSELSEMTESIGQRRPRGPDSGEVAPAAKGEVPRGEGPSQRSTPRVISPRHMPVRRAGINEPRLASLVRRASPSLPPSLICLLLLIRVQAWLACMRLRLRHPSIPMTKADPDAACGVLGGFRLRTTCSWRAATMCGTGLRGVRMPGLEREHGLPFAGGGRRQPLNPLSMSMM